MPRNPFTPTFGSSPPLLVGRGELIDRFGEALDDGPGSPGRATLYTGVRGVGKTVLLNAVEEAARRRGWLVISETAVPGLVRRLTETHLPTLLARHDPDGDRRSHLTGVSVAHLAGVDWTSTETHVASPSLRSQLEALTSILAENETGLLLTVDEVHRQQKEDLREICSAVQHAFREDRDLAFVAAGLPSAVSDLLNDDILTFLRRADRHPLGAVDRRDVAAALRQPISSHGRHISEEALAMAVEATDGYPFLIQLVGYHLWRRRSTGYEITPDDVNAGVDAARRRMGALVHEPSLADTSHVDRSFLVAMSHDDGPSRTSDLAERLGVDANYVSQYRLRLLDTELIESVGHGLVDFAMPYLRDYLREHAAAVPLRRRARF